MFVLASPLSSSLSSPSLTTPCQPVLSRTAPSPTTPQPVPTVPTVPASTAADTLTVSTAADATPTSTATDRVPAWHAGFLRMLPSIQTHARIAFRRLKKEAREEAVAEVMANAMVAYVRLVQQGRQDTAFATPLAAFAVRQVWEGRKVGGHIRVRDIMSAYCLRRNGVVIERLDRWDAEESYWQEVLVEDRTCTPAELAASRIDFKAWLASLPARDRKVAKLLASGCGTSEVAARVGLSWSRISQMRRELKASWEKFHEPREDEPAQGELSVAA